ncbi:MAG: NAD(P)/FAD-dependent oxidoreductase [bacterium]|nr:NAD(P)/FAD-dependent oxidoreductase [bacterium]
MVEKWEPVRQLFANDILTHPLSLPRLLVKAWRHIPKFRGTIASELNASISDKSARAALASMVLFAGVSAERLPISLMPGLVALMSEGLYLPEGGMGKIPEALEQSLTDQGGELVLNADVQQIVVKNGRVQGVQVAGHGFIEADTVISTASGMITFASLIKPADRPRKSHKKTQNAPLSHTALSIQLGLRNKLDVASHLNGIVPFMADQQQVFTFTEDRIRWLNYSVPTVTMPDLAPSGGSVVEMFIPVANGGNVNSWDEERKERVAALAIEALSRRHKLNIVAKRVRSPKDFKQGMHLYRGALYGLSPAASPRMQFSNQPPISGLYLAGQTTYPGFGISSVAMSGIFAAEAALKNGSEGN